MAQEVFGDTKRESTIRLWAKKYGIPSELINKERLFDSNLIDVFKQIKSMKSMRRQFSDATIELNIAQALGEKVTHTRIAAPPFQPERSTTQLEIATQSEVQEHTQTLMEALKATVEAGQKTAENYAQAMRDVGKLEALLQATQEQLTEAKKQLLMLPETTQALAKAQSEAEALRAELERERVKRNEETAALRHEIETQRRPEHTPPKGSWFKSLWTK